MNIVLASHNPVKVQATAAGFGRVFPDAEIEVASVSVPSGVAEQPRTDAETLQGAENRVTAAARLRPEADYWVGMEGGIDEHLVDGQPEMIAFAWVVIHGRDRSGRSRTGTFAIPTAVADLVRQGKELGEADDIVFGHTNSKQKSGAVGLLTGGLIDRATLYAQSVVLALIPFRDLPARRPTV